MGLFTRIHKSSRNLHQGRILPGATSRALNREEKEERTTKNCREDQRSLTFIHNIFIFSGIFLYIYTRYTALCLNVILYICR